MMTREADYAIRTMLFLASRKEREPVSFSSAALAKQAGVPYRFLRKIVGKLSAAGLVDTRRGRLGGIRMIDAPKDVSVLRIVAAMDAKGIRLNVCTSQDAAGCDRRENCAVYRPLRRLQHQLDQGLSEMTLDKFV